MRTPFYGDVAKLYLSSVMGKIVSFEAEVARVVRILVDSDGGVTLPEEVRRTLGLDAGSLVRLEIHGDAVAITRLDGSRPWLLLRPSTRAGLGFS
jgi:hypothetical protein